MKYIFTLAIITGMYLHTSAQQSSYVSLAVFNTQNGMPFGKFSGLFKEVLHPGFELGYGKTFGSKTRHDWYVDFRLGYFYHRYVQHGIPLYASLGYRHAITRRLRAETSLGAGYMHSIPATGKFRLDGSGTYKNDKGWGRMQAIATMDLALEYIIKARPAGPLRLFIVYQQRIQMPFVKEYVPLLPYNSLGIGIRVPVKTNK